MIYKFSVSKKGYGVAIFIDVDEIRDPAFVATDLLVMDKIYLRVNSPIHFLSKEDIYSFINKAIKELSSSIYDKINESTVCFHIKSVDTNPVHFQKEGLYCAMRGWLAKNYDLELASINIELDEEKEKFVFNV